MHPNGTYDVKGQDYKTTIKCNKQRDDLQTELDLLLAEKAREETACRKMLKQRGDLVELVKKNVARLTPIVADRLDESELGPQYKERYTVIMCGKIYNAFVMKDERARLDIMAICDGTKPMPQRVEPELTGFAANASFHAHLESERASPECFQALPLQNEVDATKAVKERNALKCKAEEMRLQDELEMHRKDENALWTQYHGHVSQKPQIRKKAQDDVRVKFCAVVQQNYKFDEDMIVGFFNANCIG